MSQRDERGYKVVYKTKVREPESDYTPSSRQVSSRDGDFDYDTASELSAVRRAGSEIYRSAPRSRASDYVYASQPDYTETYYRDDGVIIVETPKRRNVPRYAAEPEPDERVFQSGPARRSQRNDYEQPALVKSRTMPVYRGGQRSVVESESSRYASDDSDDDGGPRGRRDRRRPEQSPPRRLRSAIRGSRDESPGRARARSVSFREAEASRHDVGNQLHERPGAEARMMGQYLSYDDNDDLASESYDLRRGARRY